MVADLEQPFACLCRGLHCHEPKAIGQGIIPLYSCWGAQRRSFNGKEAWTIHYAFELKQINSIVSQISSVAFHLSTFSRSTIARISLKAVRCPRTKCESNQLLSRKKTLIFYCCGPHYRWPAKRRPSFCNFQNGCDLTFYDWGGRHEGNTINFYAQKNHWKFVERKHSVKFNLQILKCLKCSMGMARPILWSCW